jgi:aminocarboxymuconate-semialdehyde decarboxylase
MSEKTGGGGDDDIGFVGCEFHYHADKPPVGRNPTTLESETPRPVVVNGKRLTTIDLHAHCVVRDVVPLVEGRYELDGKDPSGGEQYSVGDVTNRLADMDAMGIDVQALSISVFHHFQWAERDLATEIVRIQNEKLADVCAKHPDRFVALGAVALQHPNLAVEQLEHMVKKLGHRGTMICASVNGEELADPKFHPFWAKAEELGALVFIHPKHFKEGAPRFQGKGFLANIIGNPLDTSVALAHLIYEGTLDRFPGVKILGAHGGGLLPSYIGRYDHGHDSNDRGGRGDEKKKPSEYLKQLYFDTLVYNTENLDHLIRECGAGQFVLGTDHPAGMANMNPIAHLLSVPGLSEDDIEDICHRTAEKLLTTKG